MVKTPLKSKSKNKNKKTSKSKNIKDFEKQEEKFDFRNEELDDYRDKVERIIKNNDTEERFEKLDKGKFKSRVINKEKIDKRNRGYGEKFFIEKNKILSGKNKGKIRLVLRTPAKPFFDRQTKLTELKIGKIISSVVVENKRDIIRRESIKLRKDFQQKQEKFNYDKFYIPEDSEPIRVRDPDLDTTVSYKTFTRYGLLIYRMKDGQKYDLIYQLSGVPQIFELQTQRDIFISYQRVVATVKEDVLNKTGITLEEWIYLSKKRGDIFVEGGITFKRFMTVVKDGRKTTEKMDYVREIDFERIF